MERYPRVWVGNPSAIPSLQAGGALKEVPHYHGCRGLAILESPHEVEELIDEVAGAERWIGEVEAILHAMCSRKPLSSQIGKGPESEMNSSNRVTVTDIQMPFGSMVVFIIKWTLASIPAMIILVVLWLVVATLFGGLLGLAQ